MKLDSFGIKQNSMSKIFPKILSGMLVTSVLFLYSFPLMAATIQGSTQPVTPGSASTNSVGTGATLGANGGASGNNREIESFTLIPGVGEVPIYTNSTEAERNALDNRANAANDRYESGALGSCIGGILGQAVARALTSAVGKTESFFKVATTDTNSQATAGASIFGVPLAVSWDSIGYCLINSIITYIADSTIAWINTGFNGNPAFLRDPKTFFENLADREAGAFVGSLVKDTLGVNACQPIKVEIATAVAGSYGNRGSGAVTQCSLSQIMKSQQGFQAFVSGQPGVATWQNFKTVSQNPQNNPNGLYLLSSDIINLSVAQKSNAIKVDLAANGGFLSYKDCKDVKVKDAAGNETTRQDCKTVTPGKVIADTASKITGIGTDRLVLAQKFDQVVTALVAQLIKTALSKAFQK